MGRLFAGCMQATSKDVLLEDCKRPEPVLTDKDVLLEDCRRPSSAWSKAFLFDQGALIDSLLRMGLS